MYRGFLNLNQINLREDEFVGSRAVRVDLTMCRNGMGETK